MTLQIRTKDSLEQLLSHCNSPAWKISDSRLEDIQKVEIYQFDGKRVLKGDFDLERSFKNDDNSLIVAFTNGKIEESDLKWIGQNPVKYVGDDSNDKRDQKEKTVKGENTELTVDDIFKTLTRKKFEKRFPHNTPFDFNRILFHITRYDIEISKETIKQEIVDGLNEIPAVSLAELYIETSEDESVISIYVFCYFKSVLPEISPDLINLTEEYKWVLEVFDYNNKLRQTYNCGDMDSGIISVVEEEYDHNYNEAAIYDNKLLECYYQDFEDLIVKTIHTNSLVYSV